MFFFEEGIKAGGIGSVFSEMMTEKGFKGNFDLTAVDNEFVKHAAVSALLSEYSLDENGMIKTILEYDDGGKKTRLDVAVLNADLRTAVRRQAR